MVSVATGMANYHENRSINQAAKVPRTEVRGLQTRQTGGFSPGTYTHAARPIRCRRRPLIFIPLCGLRKAMVITMKAGIHRVWGVPLTTTEQLPSG